MSDEGRSCRCRDSERDFNLGLEFDQRVQLIASADPMEFSFFGIFQGAVAYLAGTFRMYAARSLAAIRLLEILFAAGFQVSTERILMRFMLTRQ